MSSDTGDDPEWQARLRDWRRRLGRLRLGVEPVEVQVDRYRRATITLTLVSIVIALLFLALFTAFQRPDVGAIVVLVLLAPVVIFAWLDFARLRFRATRFLRELHEHEANQQSRTNAKTPGEA